MNDGAASPYLIDAMVESRMKRTSYAYLLWFFAGGLGFHNFYLGKPILGAAQLIAFVIFCFGSQLGGGVAVLAFPFLGLLLISVLIDAFLIPARVRAHREQLRAQLEAESDWRAA